MRESHIARHQTPQLIQVWHQNANLVFLPFEKFHDFTILPPPPRLMLGSAAASCRIADSPALAVSFLCRLFVGEHLANVASVMTTGDYWFIGSWDFAITKVTPVDIPKESMAHDIRCIC